MTRKRRFRVGITLYGEPDKLDSVTQVSGLHLWQRYYVQHLRKMGLDVIEFYFLWDPKRVLDIDRPSKNQYVFYLDERARTFTMEPEAYTHGLAYPDEAKALENNVLGAFEAENLHAIFLVNWVSTGMIIWQAALHFARPVFFTPTEHTAVCHLGFFLNPSGAACSGPGDGGKCADCTHGTEPFPPPSPVGEQWYSERFRLFYRLTGWLPKKMQRYAIWGLSSFAVPSHALLSRAEGLARLQSARRFLQSEKTLIAFQSEHQLDLFERAIGGKIPVQMPVVIPVNRQLQYKPEMDRRPQHTADGKVVFLFAARANYDRGLHFMLGAWSQWRPPKEKVKLIVRCDDAGAWAKRRVAELHHNGCDVDMAYGKLSDDQFVELHRQVHFVVNPAMWEEPLAGAVIEGFDLGTPAIVPTKTGSSNYVQPGRNGYVFEFRNKDSFIEILETAVEDMSSWGGLHQGALQASKDYHGLIALQQDCILSILDRNTSGSGD